MFSGNWESMFRNGLVKKWSHTGTYKTYDFKCVTYAHIQFVKAWPSQNHTYIEVHADKVQVCSKLHLQME